MQHIGYSLIDANGTEVMFWGDTVGEVAGPPERIPLPNGDQVHGARAGDQLGDWRFVERHGGRGAADGVSFDGTKILVTKAPTHRDVDVERDRRLSRFVFGGVTYDFDEVSRARIDKARGSAIAALIVDPSVTGYRWADPDHDFGWIAADNSYTLMTAQQTLAFGSAAAAWEGLHIVAARTLKDLPNIPEDYANDSYWPA